MPDAPFNVAIETSSRRGGVSLGRGDELIESRTLPEQQRHAVDLLPGVDAMCEQHGAAPAQLGEVYVSVGPGSFTGLRIGVTTAKVLGDTIGAMLVAVPTLDVVVRNAPEDAAVVAVCLNAKRGQCFTGVFERESADDWRTLIEPTLLSPAQLAGRVDGAVSVIADKLPPFDWPDRFTLLDRELATPRSEVAWRLGRDAASAGRFVDPIELTPMYVRLPEAEEKWQQDHA